MRSRYSAYALDDPDYIIATTHPRNPAYQEDKAAWRQSITAFSRHTQFKKLEVLSFEEKEDAAFVTFIAYLEQQGRDASFQETSRFEKVEGRWLYTHPDAIIGFQLRRHPEL
jgi:SEC-C motif-containing protein